MASLKILALNCTLKSSPKASSTEKLLREILEALKSHGKGELVRVADLNIKAGISADEGKGDEWPALLKKVMAADLIIFGTPIWLGQPSSIVKRVLERMNAFLDEKDGRQRTPAYGKVGIVAVVGNEDGAHHSAAEICQALTEVGFSIPAGAATYWVGEALGEIDYKDLKSKPKKVANWTKMLASNAAHLATLLKDKSYPGVKK